MGRVVLCMGEHTQISAHPFVIKCLELLPAAPYRPRSDLYAPFACVEDFLKEA